MSVQGECPSCGAPMTFGLGSSISQVCKYCRHVVIRQDRNFTNAGKIADLALTPSPVVVGDMGSIAGRQMSVLGRVQLDHGEGPWDEWYIGYADGSWGWLAYAQGNWYATNEVPGQHNFPPWEHLAPEMDLPLGNAGNFRILERKQGTVVSGEGELPMAVQPGQPRFYADLVGVNNGFATVDYGDRSGPPELFVGQQLPESALQITQMGDREPHQVQTDSITCPSCGGNLPTLAPNKSERLGCPYCGAVSEIASRKVIQQQEVMRSQMDIPLGTKGTLNNQPYVVCGYVERSATIEGETFGWQEYLLYGEGLGFRWLVKDESSWMFVNPVNCAELDLSGMPHGVSWGNRQFSLRNQNPATVGRVVGEFYWKVKAGSSVEAMDFVSGSDVLSRERNGDEVSWSYSSPIPWGTIAQAFSLDPNGPGGRFAAAPMAGAAFGGGGGGGGGGNTAGLVMLVLIIGALLFSFVVCGACGGCGGCGGGGYSSGGYRGGK